MPSKDDLKFIGFLINVDPSIVNLKLDNGFEIKTIPYVVGCELIGRLNGLDINQVKRIDRTHQLTFSTSKGACFIIVSNSYEKSGVENNKEIMAVVKLVEDSCKGNISEIEMRGIAIGQLCESYLREKISLINLFREGNIQLVDCYHFKESPINLVTKYYLPTIVKSKTSPFNTKELEELKDFISTNKLPSKEYLKLAHDNFELSYEVSNPTLQFLSLINGLEALFNPGKYEIVYRISRNCAVLLGDGDESFAKNIFKDIKHFYGLRSKIVHGQKKINLKEEEVNKLREYLRKSIKKLLEIDKPKDRISELLTYSGFDDGIV